MKRTVPFNFTTISLGLNVSPGIDTSTLACASGFATTASVDDVPTIALLPSVTDARNVDVPMPMAVITPVDVIVAMLVFVLVQVSGRVPMAMI